MVVEAALARARLRLVGTALSPSSLSRPLLMAAVVVGTAELLFHRIAGPAAAGIGVAPAWGRTIEAVGAAATAGSALLVVGLAVVLVLAAASPYRLAVSLALAAVLADRWVGIGSAGWAGFVLLVLAIGVVAAVAGPETGRRWGVASIGLAVAAAQVALVWTAAGPAWRALAEAALLGGVMVLAIVAARRRLGAARWVGAAAGAAVAALAFALQPGYTSLMSFWAWGASLWLPPVVYVAGAAAAGLAATVWLGDRTTRHHAAGLLLLVVAGLPPTLAHHDLTTVLGLVALAAIRWPPAAEGSV